MHILALFFSPRGRIGRQTYWNTSAVLFATGLALLAGTMGRAYLEMPPGLTDLEQGAHLKAATLENPVFWLVMLPIAWSSTALKIKRWHDLGRSSNWLLLESVPIVGEWRSFRMTAFEPGDSDANLYGAPRGEPAEGAVTKDVTATPLPSAHTRLRQGDFGRSPERVFGRRGRTDDHRP